MSKNTDVIKTALTQEDVTKLAFAKYLLALAKQHLTRPEPLASVSLLLLHDATEHLLVLCCYKVGADPSKSDFQGYWKLIEEKRTQQAPLPDRGRMVAFNKARVALKHHGNQPSRTQLQDFQTLVLNFFDNVVPEIFGLSFASINLAAFVTNKEARKHLETATAAFDEGRYTDSVNETAYAFDDIRKDNPLEKHQSSQRDPFQWMPSPPYIYTDNPSSDGNAHDFFRSVADCLQWLRESVSVLSHGTDFSRYTRFRAIAPFVNASYGGERHVVDQREDKRPHTLEEAEFCINYVIDSALQIQQQISTE
jgi:hypothetical protein